MNIGNSHFVICFAILIVTTFISALYLYSGYLVILVIKELINRLRRTIALNKYIAGQGLHPDETIKFKKIKIFNRSAMVRLIILTAVFYSIVYFNQRSNWINESSANREAKEYWVVGQVIYLPRKTAAIILHPENIVVWPFRKLQEIIYRNGILLLPEEDGERGVWKNQWFLYLYTRNSIRPYGVGDIDYEPIMVQLLDECWVAIEQMCKNSFKDKNMEKQYLLSFPVLAAYYNTHDGHYKGKYIGSSTEVRKDSDLMKRLHQILHWLNNLKNKWDETDLTEEVERKYKNVVAIKVLTEIRIVQDITLSKILNEEFTCTDPILKKLQNMYVELMSCDKDINHILSYKDVNHRQAKLIYETALYSAKGSVGKYIMENICGLKLPKERYCVVDISDDVVFYPEDHLKSIFSEELRDK